MIAAAAVWTILGLAVGGVALSNVFRSSMQSSFDSSLETDLDALIASADADPNGGVSIEPGFVNPRYQRIYSGWYWQITPLSKGPRPRFSRSLWDKNLVLTNGVARGALTWGVASGPEQQSLRVVEQRIQFPIMSSATPNEFRAYEFLVAGDNGEIDRRVADFNGTLLWSFAVLGLGLIAAILIQVRIGLQPLRRVSEALGRIRDGQARRLEGRFPSEIAPLAGELNSLIEHSAEVVARARTHVSNLAHFLKTPLTVLSSEASSQPGPLAEAVMRQVGVMRRQVDHYLSRARAAGALDVLGNRTIVRPVLDDLCRVLTRIHSSRDVAISLDCPAQLVFRGERQDLEEMAGNLIDNACKWSHQRVSVTAIPGKASFALTVEDDGPGISEEERALVGERGERLDESVPGTGFGLAIVRDIAKLYGGGFDLGESQTLGGLKVTLSLPTISSLPDRERER